MFLDLEGSEVKAPHVANGFGDEALGVVDVFDVNLVADVVIV